MIKNERPLEEIITELNNKFQMVPIIKADLPTKASADDTQPTSHRESTDVLEPHTGSSSFLTLSREKVAKLKDIVMAGEQNFGKYHVKYQGVDRRLPYENLTFNRKAQPIMRVFEQNQESQKKKSDVRQSHQGALQTTKGKDELNATTAQPKTASKLKEDKSMSKTQRHFMASSSVEKVSQSTSSPATKLRVKTQFRVKQNHLSQSRKQQDSFKNFTFLRDRPVRDTFLDHLPQTSEQRFVKKESVERFLGDSKYKREKMLVNIDK